MKLKCLCDFIISDTSDNLPYKARVIADEDWEAFSTGNPNFAWQYQTDLYQCPQCGRLIMEKPTGYVQFFTPEISPVLKTILVSVTKDPRSPAYKRNPVLQSDAKEQPGK